MIMGTSRDGRLTDASSAHASNAGTGVVCSDATAAQKIEEPSSEDAANLRHYCDTKPIALWEEDWSRLKIRIDQLRNAGVTDFRSFLSNNSAMQSELVKEIRWKGFNDTAIDLYRADNRSALEQYLRPAPVTAFTAYPEAIASFLEGSNQVAINTTDRAVDGTELRIIETFKLPKDFDPDWKSVMSSSQDISDLRQAQNNVAIQQHDFEQARLAVQNVERAQPTGDLLDLKTLEDATFGAFLDTLFLAVFLIGSDLRIVHANKAGRTMLSNGDPVRSAGGLLTLQSQASTIALIAAVAQAGNNEPGTGPWNRHSIPAPSSTGTPHVLHVVPLRPSVLRLGPLASTMAAVFITSAPGTTLCSIDALAAQFDLTRTEARVFSKIALGMTLRQVACSLNIETSTAKTHLLRIFSKTGTNRQVDLVRLAVSLALPI